MCACVWMKQKNESTFNLHVIKTNHSLHRFLKLNAFCAFLLRLLIVCFNSSFIGTFFSLFAFQSEKSHFYLFIATAELEKSQNEDGLCIPFTETKLIFNICFARKYFPRLENVSSQTKRTHTRAEELWSRFPCAPEANH